MTFRISKSLELFRPARYDTVKFLVGRLILFVLLASAQAANLAAAATLEPLLGAPEEPWHIAADDLSYDNQSGEYVARGDVTITKGDRHLKADFVRFNHKTMRALAVGNIVLNAGQDVITCNRMEINLESEVGTVYDGTLFLETNHFYITGHQIEKIAPDAYKARDVSITTCDGDNPDWRITARNLEVTIEGYGVARHAALRVREVPVLYTPWLAFPVKLQRQTGLLPPQMGYATRRGAEYIQPFFWAINRSSDATFYGHFMQKRGFRTGAEYRYVLDRTSQGTLMLDGFEDRHSDDGTPAAARDWGYAQDAYARPNTDRYWFRAKNDQTLGHGFKAQADLDVVSDQDYLQEFRSGYMGFDDTRDYFNKNFNRELDDYNDPVRVNRLNVSRIGSGLSLNAEARYYDDVIKRRQADQDDTLHKLPYVSFDVAQKPLGSRHLYVDLDSEYTHFYRSFGTRGHRLDLYPRAYFPFRFFDILSLEPSVGIRETVWAVDEFADQTDDPDRVQTRSLYDARVDLSTELAGTWSTALGSVDRIKHTLRPHIIYEYLPNKDQTTYPDFDATDRIAQRNRVTYSLTNQFTSRSKQAGLPEPATPDSGGASAAGYNYRSVGRFKLEQSYDINEANEDNPLNWANQESRRPFSPVYGEIEFTPYDYFTLHADAEWSQYGNDFLSHNVATRLADKRGDYLYVEHRYTQGTLQSLYTNLKLKIRQRITGYADYERNLLEDATIQTTIGLLFEAQCWSADFRFQDDGDKSYQVMINLYGLGGIGN